ncbi:hypothetical protein AC249_AIPGENE10219 [Exaiptasia diaphana]|nr:hypothetical protein AC249_AIPGENE10219 [Exaiptasia diaphana]
MPPKSLKRKHAISSNEKDDSIEKICILHHKTEESQPLPNRSTRTSSASSIKFPETCIFCDRGRAKITQKGHVEYREISQFAVYKDDNKVTIEPTWKQIEPCALELEDYSLHRKVHGQDLFAREACYHPSCRKAFNLRYINHLRNKKRSEKQSMTERGDQEELAHTEAFDKVLDFIQEHVVKQGEIVQLVTLRRLYIQELEKCGYTNPEYRSDYLKARLEKHEVNELISFAKVDPGNKGFITYTLVSSLEDAVTHAYLLGSRDQYEDVALLLRKLIQKAFKNAAELPWPLTILILIAQMDICRGVTNGQWKLPKHILLCTTLRHLYRSKQLTTIIKRLCHCETYNFGLELETSLAKALDEVSTSLTPMIVTGEGNEVLHFEWDNMNKITTNIHGSNVVNSTAGIMIQEVNPGFDSDVERALPIYN